MTPADELDDRVRALEAERQRLTPPPPKRTPRAPLAQVLELLHDSPDDDTEEADT